MSKFQRTENGEIIRTTNSETVSSDWLKFEFSRFEMVYIHVKIRFTVMFACLLCYKCASDVSLVVQWLVFTAEREGREVNKIFDSTSINRDRNNT